MSTGAPASRRSALPLPVVLALAAAGGCHSPEAERVRGGDAGADAGNRDIVVELHAGALPYAGTPCLTSLPECTGPLPVSGLTGEGADRVTRRPGEGR